MDSNEETELSTEQMQSYGINLERFMSSNKHCNYLREVPPKPVDSYRLLEKLGEDDGLLLLGPASSSLLNQPRLLGLLELLGVLGGGRVRFWLRPSA